MRGYRTMSIELPQAKLTPSKSFLQLSDTSRQDDITTAKKRFLFRLLHSLHSSGNYCFRTEKLVTRVARKYELHAVCGILTRSATISFQGSNQLNPSSCESYNFHIKRGWNVHRLSLLDALCFDITKAELPFDTAVRRLEKIVETPSFPWYAVMLAYAVSSLTATVLFFNGDFRDAAWSFLLGMLVYAVHELCTRFRGLSEIESFVASFFVIVIATLLDNYVYDKDLCLYGLTFGGVVWLLPGITITVSLIEIYSKMMTYGAAMLTFGIVLASQIGFGLTIGYEVVSLSNGLPYTYINGCQRPEDPLWGLLLLPLQAIASGVLLGCDVSQLPGMVIVAGVGQLASFLLTLSGVGDTSIPFLSAVCVTCASRLYVIMTGTKRPLVYVLAGLLVLVPGGVGVRGMSDMWSDSSTGMAFTFKMLLIGVSLATGVFTAMIPSSKWAIIKFERVPTVEPHEEIVIRTPGGTINEHETHVANAAAAMEAGASAGLRTSPGPGVAQFHVTVVNPLARRDTYYSEDS